MDQLHGMWVFVAVAEEQGFAAAARRLNLSPPAVTRAIAALEASLGVSLLVRTTRHVRTTDAGQRYLEDAKRILAQVQMANETAQGVSGQPMGRISVTAPVMFGQMFVMPGIVEYLQSYPDTQVDAVFLDRVVSLLEEGFDVGIRIGQLADSNMLARKVGSVRLILVASPEYLSRQALPQTPADIKQHRIISSSSNSIAHDWHFQVNGHGQSIRIQPRLTVTTNQAAINAAKLGFGIARVLSYQVAQELANGELKIVLENFEPQPMPINIIHREGRLASNKIRSFIDVISKRLREDPALN